MSGVIRLSTCSVSIDELRENNSCKKYDECRHRFQRMRKLTHALQDGMMTCSKNNDHAHRRECDGTAASECNIQIT
jgi:hypothetical protein